MPVMDGFQLCMNVKQDNRLRDIPFLFYSATYVDELDEDLAIMMGAARFIRKPEEPEEFTRIIDEMLTEFREGRFRPIKSRLECQGILLQRYNDRIVNKLQEKMLDLENVIAERKKAEEATDRANQEWERTFNAISDLVMVLDDQHKIVRANKAMADALGITEHELRGKPCFELVHGKKEPPAFCPHSQLLADGAEHSTEVVEPRLGGIYDVRVSPLVGQNGRVTGSVHIIRDITESKRAEEALKESERQYRTLFEESIDGVYSVLREGQIIDANSSFCQLFGYKKEEMLCRNIRELYLDPDDRPRFQKEIEKRGFVKDYEIQGRKRDGTKVDCLITSSVQFAGDGSVAGYRGIVRDLTARKALQRQLLQAQKMEAIATLAGGIAHDFNNLLQVVLGYSDMMLFGKKSTDPDHIRLEAIRRAAQDGAELTKGLLAFSRRLEPNARPVNLNNEIERVQKILQRTLPKMIQIEILLADDLMTVNADPGQMEQILLNLAVNAQHAMPDGGRFTMETANVILDEDYCRTHPEIQSGEYAALTVSDTGHGMDQGVVEHIFEPFYTTKGPGEGTGLGLAMVFGIVKSHGGCITCYSEPGAGTTFKIYLPAVVQDEEADASVTQQIPAFGTETILVVDDETRIRKMLGEMLQLAGYTVLEAGNGEEALNIYRKRKADISLVILDLIMPVMGGKQCIDGLLKIEPNLKILVATGFGVDESTRRAVEEVSRGFVNKPYDVRQLLRVVREVLDGR